MKTSLWQTFALHLDANRPGFARGPWFTMNAVLELDGALNPSALAAAFHELQRRHDVLRTEIVDQSQLIHPAPTAELELVDAVETHAEVPLAAPVRLRLAGNRLALHLHHMVADPVTLWTTLDELAALYSAQLTGAAVPPPAAQYADYTLNEAALVERQRGPASDWWQARLTDAKPCPQPPAQPAKPFAYRDQLLTPSELTAVNQRTLHQRSTPLVTLLAALAAGMTPYVGAGDTLVFATLFSKRDRPQWQRVLGPCIVPSVLAIPRDADIATVREAVVGCSRHARFPVLEADVPPRSPFFEYVPQQWPPGYHFGPVQASITAVAGPKDTGLADILGIRLRPTTTNALTGHFSGDGTDWTEPLVSQVCAGMRNHLVS
ncbi:condensation domain-containing protein [Kribbella sp. NPDC056345]|uniref:condensation domain-containing protein n=1 Tax=Kribbella sp. NPDC056345 TaxID=3345789 RepID=UPI0035DF0FBA